MTTQEFSMLALAQLHESKMNPRLHFPAASMQQLAENIGKVGVLVPLLVRPLGDGRGFEIIDGARRYRAAKVAKVAELPARIREMTDAEALEATVIANLQREDVHPLEEATGYAALMKATGQDVPEIAAKVGRSVSYVYQRLKLAELISPVKEAFLAEQISAGHAILIARLTPKDQAEALKQCFMDQYGYPRRGGDGEPLSVRDLGRWIEREIHLDLHKASFKKDDATLLPAAGPCTTCPKRTGFTPELFPDVAKKDTCTDRACFKAKIQAFSDRVLADAQSSGEELLKLSGEWTSRKSKSGAISRNDWAEAKPGSCTHVKRGILIEDAQGVAGRVLTVCAEPTCKKHRGYADSSNDAARRERWKRDAQRSQEKRTREMELRRRILAGIRERVTATLTRGDLQLVAVEYFCDLWSDLRKPLMKLEGWIEEKAKGSAYYEHEKLAAKKIPAMTDAELARFLVTTSLMKTCEVPQYGAGRSKDGLLEAAKRWGVNVTAIEKQLAAEHAERDRTRKEREKKKVKTAAKAKGNGKKEMSPQTIAAKLRGAYPEPTCVACGCTETTACQTAAGPCSWAKLNKKTNAGLCSACVPAKKTGNAVQTSAGARA